MKVGQIMVLLIGPWWMAEVSSPLSVKDRQSWFCLLVRRLSDSEGRSFVPHFGFGELGRRFRNGNGSLPPAATENLHSAAGTSEQ